MIHIYNTLSQQKEQLQPIIKPNLGIYVCGLTAYDDCHLGHGRLFIWFDTLVRYLRSLGYQVTYVRNITDIDDKIIKRACELNLDYRTLTTNIISSMHADEKLLNIIPPNFEPRVTEHIPEIILMIQTLIDKKFAYLATNGDVYFSVEKFKSYGNLAHQELDSLLLGARVEPNEEKNNPLDFVLWKKAKPNEPFWSSPWGDGRPGWHIECSAMAKKYLGNNFEIHGGGSDLQFPHHQNELAQSEAANGYPFANYWMHIGFVQYNQEKMSKSLGNFLTLKELLNQYPPEVLRYFMLASHYRSPINFSEENMHQAWAALKRLYTTLRKLLSNTNSEELTTPITFDPNNYFYHNFHLAMADDFNTPRALAVLFELAHEINQLHTDKKLNQAKPLAILLKELATSIGLLQESPNTFLQAGIELTKIDELIASRNHARQEKNWSESDRIRQELLNLGVLLEDTPNGTKWSLKEMKKPNLKK